MNMHTFWHFLYERMATNCYCCPCCTRGVFLAPRVQDARQAQGKWQENAHSPRRARPRWRLAAVLLPLVLGACAIVPTFPAAEIRRVEVSPRSLYFICDGPRWTADSNTNGCYKMSGSVCTIYVLTLEEWTRRGRPCKYFAVIEHEEKHCREGDWHGSVPTASVCAPGSE